MKNRNFPLCLFVALLSGVSLCALLKLDEPSAYWVFMLISILLLSVVVATVLISYVDTNAELKKECDNLKQRLSALQNSIEANEQKKEELDRKIKVLMKEHTRLESYLKEFEEDKDQNIP